MVVALVIFGIVTAVALANANKDTEPPQVYIEAPAETPAHIAFDIFMSANEPVTYKVRYGDTELEEVAQDYKLSLIAKEGEQTVDVVAIDAANNESSYQFKVRGIAAVKPMLHAPGALTPGEPFSVEVTWQEGFKPSSLEVIIAGNPINSVLKESSALAISSIPLGSQPQQFPITVKLGDEHGRVTTASHMLEVLPYPQEVEELNLTSSTLSVVTPEGRALENQVLEAAYAKKDEHPAPRWTEAFVLPVIGRDTSGFGSPRRYVRGGNVSYHSGADIAAPTGVSVLATNKGKVLIADFFPIKGGFVLIDHGSRVFSYYFHLSTIHVKAGDMAEVGQVIGEVGSTGLSTGPHLHWEMRVDGISSNPMSWVGKVNP